MIWSFWGK